MSDIINNDIPLENQTPSQPVYFKDLMGNIDVVTTAPSHTPKKLRDSIKLYVSGGTIILYVYDNVNNAWRNFTGA